jgi:hypothetical protein
MKNLLTRTLMALAVLTWIAPAPAMAQVAQAYQATVSNKVTNVPVTASTPLPVTFSGNTGVIGGDGSTIASASNPLPVTPIGSGYSAAVSLTRTADANAYAAGDVLGAATGSTAALTFASMGPSGGRIVISSVSLEVDLSSVPSGMTSFTLYLYNVTPPSATGDNGAWDLPSGDRASFLGKIDLGTPVDLGSTLYVEQTSVNKQIKLSGTSIFAYLVTTGAYTPASGTVYKVTLHAVGL